MRGNLYVQDDFTPQCPVYVSGDLYVGGNLNPAWGMGVSVGGSAYVNGNASFSGQASIGGELYTGGDLSLNIGSGFYIGKNDRTLPFAKTVRSAALVE